MEVAFGRRSGVGCWGCVPLGVLAQRGALLRAVRQRVLQPLERLRTFVERELGNAQTLPVEVRGVSSAERRLR